MSLSAREAIAVNDLLRWLFQITRFGQEIPSHGSAMAAAELLAESASNRLHAGLRGADVASRKNLVSINRSRPRRAKGESA